MTTQKKVIIDTDPGIDDAVAILLALNVPSLNVIGITTVSGNTEVDEGTVNALKVLEYAGRPDIPVFRGSEKPLVKSISFSDVCHGSDGLGDSGLPSPALKPQDINAHKYLMRAVLEHPGEVTILSIGPMTNLARAILEWPDVMSKTKEIVSMGGGINIGNMSPVAEFNYWTDPDAARIVYGSGIHLTMVGLNATTKVVFTPNDLQLMQQFEDKNAKFINSVSDFYFNYYWEYERVFGVIFHDPMAVLTVIDDSFGQFLECNVNVCTDGITRGECVADVTRSWHKELNARVMIDVDFTLFKDLFFALMFNGQECKVLYKRYKESLRAIGGN